MRVEEKDIEAQVSERPARLTVYYCLNLINQYGVIEARSRLGIDSLIAGQEAHMVADPDARPDYTKAWRMALGAKVTGAWYERVKPLLDFDPELLGLVESQPDIPATERIADEDYWMKAYRVCKRAKDIMVDQLRELDKDILNRPSGDELRETYLELDREEIRVNRGTDSLRPDSAYHVMYGGIFNMEIVLRGAIRGLIDLHPEGLIVEDLINKLEGSFASFVNPQAGMHLDELTSLMEKAALWIDDDSNNFHIPYKYSPNNLKDRGRGLSIDKQAMDRMHQEMAENPPQSPTYGCAAKVGIEEASPYRHVIQGIYLQVLGVLRKI